MIDLFHITNCQIFIHMYLYYILYGSEEPMCTPCLNNINTHTQVFDVNMISFHIIAHDTIHLNVSFFSLSLFTFFDVLDDLDQGFTILRTRPCNAFVTKGRG
jgi:hypothetical protein